MGVAVVEVVIKVVALSVVVLGGPFISGQHWFSQSLHFDFDAKNQQASNEGIHYSSIIVYYAPNFGSENLFLFNIFPLKS